MVRTVAFLCLSGLISQAAFAGPTNPALRSSSPAILSFSATAEGNGYNWPATLGWLSEQLMITREEGLELERQGRDVKVDITSIGGGSSGSAVTILMDAAISNPSLVDPADQQRRLLTLDEVKRVADTVRYVSLALDLTTPEKTLTIARGIAKQFKTRTAWLASHIPFLKAWFKIERPIWFPFIESKHVVSEFGRYIYFTRNVDYKVINQPIASLPGFAEIRASSRANKKITKWFSSVHTVFDLPSTGSADDDATERDERKWLSEFAQARRAALKAVIMKSLAAAAPKVADIMNRYGADMTPTQQPEDKQKNPFARVLGEKMKTGFMTISMVAHFDSKDDFDKDLRADGKIDYSQLRLYAFMDESTAKLILNSPEYREALRDPDSRIHRFVIAVVDQVFAAMNPSVREPGLMEELYGDANSDQFRIKKIYDPAFDSAREFQLVGTDDPRFDGRPLFVVGGFAAELITAQIQSIIHVERIAELTATGAEVIPRYHTLAKPHRWFENKTFATHNLATMLNEHGKDGAIQNVEDYFKWMEDFYRYDREMLKAGKGALIQTWLNWDVRLLPGALAGVADLQVAKAANAAREAWKVWSTGTEFKPEQKAMIDRDPKAGLLDPRASFLPPKTCNDLWLAKSI